MARPSRDRDHLFSFHLSFRSSLRIENSGFLGNWKLKWRYPFPLLKRAGQSVHCAEKRRLKGKTLTGYPRRGRTSTFFDLRVITRMHGPARRVLINVIQDWSRVLRESAAGIDVFFSASLFSAIRLDRIPMRILDTNRAAMQKKKKKGKKRKNARSRCLMDFDRKCEANVTWTEWAAKRIPFTAKGIPVCGKWKCKRKKIGRCVHSETSMEFDI